MTTKYVIETTASIKELIVKCTEKQQLLFKRMYSPKDLDKPILEVVDDMSIDSIKRALEQINITLFGF